MYDAINSTRNNVKLKCTNYKWHSPTDSSNNEWFEEPCNFAKKGYFRFLRGATAIFSSVWQQELSLLLATWIKRISERCTTLICASNHAHMSINLRCTFIWASELVISPRIPEPENPRPNPTFFNLRDTRTRHFKFRVYPIHYYYTLSERK